MTMSAMNDSTLEKTINRRLPDRWIGLLVNAGDPDNISADRPVRQVRHRRVRLDPAAYAAS